MRNFRRWFYAFLAVSLVCMVPMLYRAKPKANQGSHAVAGYPVPSRGMELFEDRLQFSQPVWLLVLGTTLIISADRLSKIVHARRRVPLGAAGCSNVPARGTTGDDSSPEIALGSAHLKERKWQAAAAAHSAVERRAEVNRS
jgi:hypothetical protein